MHDNEEFDPDHPLVKEANDELNREMAELEPER